MQASTPISLEPLHLPPSGYALVRQKQEKQCCYVRVYGGRAPQPLPEGWELE